MCRLVFYLCFTRVLLFFNYLTCCYSLPYILPLQDLQHVLCVFLCCFLTILLNLIPTTFILYLLRLVTEFKPILLSSYCWLSTILICWLIYDEMYYFLYPCDPLSSLMPMLDTSILLACYYLLYLLAT